MILHIRFRRTALVATLPLTGSSQVQTFEAGSEVIPLQFPSSALSVPSELASFFAKQRRAARA